MEYLALTIMAENKLELPAEITKAISQTECTIYQCNINTLANEMVISFLLSGTWNIIAKLDAQLKILEKKYNLQLFIQKTAQKSYEQKYLPYLIYIIAPEKRGVLNEVTQFLYDMGIEINEIHSEVYTARNTATQMLSINLNINIPETLPISDLREKFFIFCDQFNLDGILEPDKS